MAMRNSIKSTIIGLLILIASCLIVTAMNVQTVYNSFTGKLDYVQTANFTGENMTASSLVLSQNLTASNCMCSIADTYVTDNWVNESGDTMTGNLNMGTNNISALYFKGNATDVECTDCLGTSEISDVYVLNTGVPVPILLMLVT